MGTHRRGGLTLVELLVVLAILAIMTTMAVTATSSLVDQARYDATQRTLEEIRTAVLGTGGGTWADGNVSGFIADIGRLPTSIDELTSPIIPPGLFPYGIRNVDSDGDLANDLALASGWRGPYLRLPVGTTSLRDGWGNPLGFNLTAPPPPHALAILSRGADGQLDPPNDGYNADLPLSIVPNDYLTTVSFHVRQLDSMGQEIDPTIPAGEMLEVVIYSASGTNSTTIAPDPATVTGPSFLRSNIRTPGIMAVSAVVKNGATVTKKSAVIYVTSPARSSISKKLILPAG